MKMRARAVEGQFRSAKHIAKRRNLFWNISRDDYRKLREQPCTYCGGKLPETGLGIDRVDASLGYVLKNVVPCCSDCNRAKGAAFTFDEMLVIGKAIANVKANRKDGCPQLDHFKPRKPKPKKHLSPFDELN